MNYKYITVKWNYELTAWSVNAYCDKVKRCYEVGLFDTTEEAERFAAMIITKEEHDINDIYRDLQGEIEFILDHSDVRYANFAKVRALCEMLNIICVLDGDFRGGDWSPRGELETIKNMCGAAVK